MPAKKPALSGDSTIAIKIVSDVEHQRLDKALTILLAQHVPGISRARVQSLLKAGHINFLGKPIFDASHKTKCDETYLVHLPAPEPTHLVAEDMDLVVVYEDNFLLVIDKPAGLVVHPAPGNRQHTLVNALLAHCGKSLSGIGGVARPGIVHRLDKDTSGLMVIAKTDQAHQYLTQQFSDRSLQRVYQAIVWGIPHQKQGTIEAPIGRHTRDRKKMAVLARGRSALTRYKVLKEYGVASLIECTLATGRTHQIRVHLAHSKYPVVGDPVYGSKKGVPLSKVPRELLTMERQALHAVKLTFKHPKNGKVVSFSSALPKDMLKLIHVLKKKT